MTLNAARFCCFTALAVLLAGCANTQQGAGPSEPAAQASAPASGPATPASAQAAAPAEAEPEEPLTPAEAKNRATAQCWMKYDRTAGSLEAKAKLVDKCLADKQKPVAANAKPSAKPKP